MALEVSSQSLVHLSGRADELAIAGWILWPALAIMMAESIISVSVVTFSTLAGPLGLKKPPMGIIDVDEETRRSLDGNENDEVSVGGRSEEEADQNVVLGGVVLSCIACVVLVAVVFGEEGIKWWATVIALVLASIFSVLG